MWADVVQFLTGLVVIVGALDDNPVNPAVFIQLNNSIIHGVQLTAENQRTFYGFLGIPYAKPPTGPLRFKPPVAFGPLPKKLNATFEGFNCLQEQILGDKRVVMGDEDCLVLNVFVPKIKSLSNNLPVMIFIPGGAFRSMSGSMFYSGPHKFLSHDIVLVTINYRLGPLGFLSTGDDVSPGNFGLLDQLMALQWINNNIQAFGGNRHQITLFGQSAGAMSVNLHMLSPLTKGLFRNVILQSGTAYIANVVDEHPLLKAQELAMMMGCPISPSQVLITCLLNCSAATLVSKGNLMPLRGQIKLFPRFTPVVDGFYLLDKPNTLMDQGKFHEGLSVISGIIKDEFFYFYPQVMDEVLNNSYSIKKLNRTFVALNSVSPSEVTPFLIDPIADEYFSHLDIYNETAFREAAVDTMTDALFTAPFSKFIKAVVNRFPTYAYTFVYRGPFSIVDFENPEIDDNKSVTHGDDLVFLFEGVWSTIKFSPEEVNVSRNWISLWVNFATYNNPTPDGFPIVWNQVSNSSNIEYLEIGRNFTMKSGYRSDKIIFWNEYIASLINKTETELLNEDTVALSALLTSTASPENISIVDEGESGQVAMNSDQLTNTKAAQSNISDKINNTRPPNEENMLTSPPLPGQSMPDYEETSNDPNVSFIVPNAIFESPAVHAREPANDIPPSMWRQMSDATLGKLLIGCSVLALCSLLIIALTIDPLVKYCIRPDEEKVVTPKPKESEN